MSSIAPSGNVRAGQPTSERYLHSLVLLLCGLIGSIVLFSTIDVPEAIRASIGGSEFRVRSRMWSFNTVLLLLGVLLGSVFAHRAGLVSLIVHRVPDARRRRRTLPLFAVVGVATGFILAAFDTWLTTAMPSVQGFVQAHESALSSLHWEWRNRVLYGGLTMELMWRWGVMSLIAWACLRALPRRPALAAAILLSSVLFALDHLPLLYQSVPDVPTAMVVRVLVLNTVIGSALGTAYARHSLEAAMIMHGAMNMIGIGVGVG